MDKKKIYDIGIVFTDGEELPAHIDTVYTENATNAISRESFCTGAKVGIATLIVFGLATIGLVTLVKQSRYYKKSKKNSK